MKATPLEPVKLVASLFTGEPALFRSAFERLVGEFGPIDILTEPLAFSTTDYYEEEFGGGLARKLASFERLILPEELSSVKLFTNRLEDEFTVEGKRRINIDPGYMTLDKFVLASCKNFSHRIYVGDGVYADLTLLYEYGGFKSLPWSYSDYTGKRMLDILTQVRRRYAHATGRGLKRG